MLGEYRRHGGFRAVCILLLFLFPFLAAAESVYVKYRGPVDLAPFDCHSISRSSVVQRVCYDSKERYMLISLRGTYYHYCEIEPSVVNGLLNADSMGRYYSETIKGNYDCRVNRMPAYRH